MKVAIDTNIFGYAAGVGADEAKRETAMRLLKDIPAESLVIPSQVAGEFYNILVKKGRASPRIATKIVRDWSDSIGLAAHTPAMMFSAIEAAGFHDLQVWDALILTIADAADCRLLLSEDMQDGFVYREITVANPFADSLHPLLASLLDSLPGAPA